MVDKSSEIYKIDKINVLSTISYDALYNYTKSQKISAAYCKPFQHSKEKTCRGGGVGHNVPLSGQNRADERHTIF